MYTVQCVYITMYMGEGFKLSNEHPNYIIINYVFIRNDFIIVDKYILFLTSFFEYCKFLFDDFFLLKSMI